MVGDNDESLWLHVSTVERNFVLQILFRHIMYGVRRVYISNIWYV